MTETRLREALHAAAERVAPPELAKVAWEGARRYRVRRAGAISGALLVAAVTSVVVLTTTGGQPAPSPGLGRPSGTHAPTRSSTAPTGPAGPTPTTVFQAGPSGAQERSSPLLDTRLRGLDLRARPAAVLSPAHRGRIVAAYLLGRGPYTAVLLLDSGERVRLDAVLQPNSDPAGNPQPVLDPRAVSADRSRVIFLQANGVVVADTSTGTARRWKSPGPFYGAGWLTADELVLTRSAGNVLFDVRTGQIAATRVEGELAAGGGALSVLMRPMRLSSAASADRIVTVPMDPGIFGDSSGAAFLRSGRVATGVYTAHVNVSGVQVSNPQGVAVADTASGLADRLLVINYDTDHGKGCCPVLGWLDDDTVLYANVGQRLLAWNVGTGELRRVIDLPATAELALGDIARDAG